MRYLSLFSGIEACTVAWHELGWKAAAYAEFDEFPSAALKHHYPDIENLGDVSKITDDTLRRLGSLNLIVGGSPCQDLSIAGKRTGLEGARSGLFYEQMRIFHAARLICGARYLLWENVPGAYSSNEGRDFAQVVGEMAGCSIDLPPDTGWENTGCAIGENGLVEWCTLDAQWFGVPQRRRRIFALLDTGDWASRSPILFEPESMCGNTPPCRESRKEVTEILIHSIEEYRKPVGALCDGAHNGGGLNGQDAYSGRIIPAISVIPINDKSTRHKGATGKGSGNGLGVGVDGDPCPTLTAGDKHAVAFQSYDSITQSNNPSDICQTLDVGKAGGNAVCFAQNSRNELREMPYSGAIAAQPGMKQQSFLRSGLTVRRLTPLECERLQGFPDNYTKIPWKGKPAEQCLDGPRYKALGNSMAVPVMRWIGGRIDESNN